MATLGDHVDVGLDKNRLVGFFVIADLKLVDILIELDLPDNRNRDLQSVILFLR